MQQICSKVATNQCTPDQLTGFLHLKLFTDLATLRFVELATAFNFAGLANNLVIAMAYFLRLFFQDVQFTPTSGAEVVSDVDDLTTMSEFGKRSKRFVGLDLPFRIVNAVMFPVKSDSLQFKLLLWNLFFSILA